MQFETMVNMALFGAGAYGVWQLLRYLRSKEEAIKSIAEKAQYVATHIPDGTLTSRVLLEQEMETLKRSVETPQFVKVEGLYGQEIVPQWFVQQGLTTVK